MGPKAGAVGGVPGKLWRFELVSATPFSASLLGMFAFRSSHISIYFGGMERDGKVFSIREGFLLARRAAFVKQINFHAFGSVARYSYLEAALFKAKLDSSPATAGPPWFGQQTPMFH